MARFEILFSNYTNKTEFRTKDASREEIETCLEQTRDDTCYFDVEYLHGERNVRITLHSENGEYYMLYHDTTEDEEDEDGELDTRIKTYYNPNRSEKIVHSPTDGITDYMICDDFNIVKEVFRQLIEDKTVSEELLNDRLP